MLFLQTMLTDANEVLYHPSHVTVYGGDSIGTLKELNSLTIPSEEHVTTLLRNCPEEYRSVLSLSLSLSLSPTSRTYSFSQSCNLLLFIIYHSFCPLYFFAYCTFFLDWFEIFIGTCLI